MSTEPTPPLIPPEPAPATPTPPPSPGQAAFTNAGAPPGSIFVEIDRPCASCSYNLRGLPVTGTCPECGKSVAFSLRGILLQFASQEYLQSIRSGVSLILNGILLSIIVMVVGIFIAIAARNGVGMNIATGSTFEFMMALSQLIPTAMIMLGYWRFTLPDPSFVGVEKPDSARSIVRIAVCIQAGFQILNLLVLLSAMAGFGAGLVVEILTAAIGIVGLIAWAVQFFAMMLYLRWLTVRIPDSFILKRIRTYIWLLPVLGTVGALACGLGPLFALIMYWNLLDRVRKHLKAIIATGEPAVLPQTGL